MLLFSGTTHAKKFGVMFPRCVSKIFLPVFILTLACTPVQKSILFLLINLEILLKGPSAPIRMSVFILFIFPLFKFLIIIPLFSLPINLRFKKISASAFSAFFAKYWSNFFLSKTKFSFFNLKSIKSLPE